MSDPGTLLDHRRLYWGFEGSGSRSLDAYCMKFLVVEKFRDAVLLGLWSGKNDDRRSTNFDIKSRTFETHNFEKFR